MDNEPTDSYELLFDPDQFRKKFPAPTIEEFKLDAKDMEMLGITGSTIRDGFRKKSKIHGRAQVNKSLQENNERSRKGIKYSVASRNPLGQSETEIKNQTMKETVPARQYRARHRKNVSLKEQQEIVDEYLEKNYQQKEIARRFRVKVQLVRDLVRESKNNPEKMNEAKKREKKAA